MYHYYISPDVDFSVYDIKDESAIFPDHIDYGFAYLSVKEFTEKKKKKFAMQESGIQYENIFDEYVSCFVAHG